MRDRFGKVCIGIVAVFFVAAGLGKLIALDEFLRSLESWTLLPASLRPIVSIFVPTIEIFLAGAWLVGVIRRPAAVGLLAILIVFTGYYLVHVAASVPPDCNCLGKLAAYRSGMQSAWYVVGRNAALLSVLCTGLFMTRNVKSPGPITGDGGVAPTCDEVSR